MKNAPIDEPVGVDALGDFTTVNRRMLFVSSASIVVGLAAALIAVALLFLIGFFTNLFFYGRVAFSFVSPAANQLGYLEVLVPIIGGLLVGLMAKYGSERIKGHGIPEALEAILVNKSRIDPKVTVLKPVSTAVSIGSGGPFGAEGPIIMTGGSFGSVVGQMLRLSSMERKTLLVAGAAAGMAATFNSPVAAVLIAVELLLFEWRPRSLIPVGIASATATVVRGMVLGTNALFPVPLTQVPDLPIVLSAAAVGLVAGSASTALTYTVYAAEDAFRKVPIHWMWWPAIGGLVIGLGGLVAPRALGVGYDTIDLLLVGKLAVGTIAVLALVKGVIWSVSLGSGTSGGVLAPLLMLGGSLGALESLVLPGGSAALWVMVSMGAMLGGTMRSPFTGVVFLVELTHDVNALLPLLVAAMVADFVTVFTMKRSILTEKVARRGVHVAREYGVDVLEQVPVARVMRTEFETVKGDTPVDAIVRNAFSSDKGAPIAYVVLDEGGLLEGYLTRDDLLRMLYKHKDERIEVRELARKPDVVAYPTEPVGMAADRMAKYGTSCIPVVNPSNRRQVVGVMSRDDVFRAREIWFEEERTLERSLSLSSLKPSTWLQRWASGRRDDDSGEDGAA